MATQSNRGKGLSAAFVRTVNKPGRYTDTNGLMLIVSEAGSKRWGQRVTIQKKRCDLGLGGYPVVSLSEARELAEQNRKVARAGGDPRAEKRARTESLTFEAVTQQALAVKLVELSNAKHRQQWENTLSSYVYPKFGWKRVEDVSAGDVVRALEPIWQTKTETASRLRARIEYILDFATAHGMRKGDNPARWKGNLEFHLATPSKVTKVRHRPALQLDHAGQWFKLLRLRHGNGARALEFLALTAARSGEVRGMTWYEVDLEKALWTVPADRMKAGREHRVPLSYEAVAILKNQTQEASEPYVFFAPRGGALSDMTLSEVMRKMQRQEAYDGAKGFLDRVSGRPAVPHGLRSTFRQWTAEQGYPRDMAEMALAHRVGSEVERAYQRSDMMERRRGMMQVWADFLSTSANALAPGLAKEFLVSQSHLRSVG